MVEDMKQYIGKEVIIKSLKTKGRLSKITGAKIEVETESMGWRVFYTGTGKNDNAVANGQVVFADPALKDPFLKDYEDYRHSFIGQAEAFEDAFLRYD